MCSCRVQCLRVVWALAAGFKLVVESFGSRGALGMVSSEHLVALQALLWCPNVT